MAAGILSTGVGYRGWCKILDEGTTVGLPILGSTLQKNPNIIIADGVIHGSSGAQAASVMHYAEGFQAFQGDIRTHYFAGDAGGAGDITTIIKNWAYALRSYDPADSLIRTIVLCPNGVDVYSYTQCYVRSVTLSASGLGGAPGALVEVTLDVVAMGMTEVATGAGGPSFNPTTAAVVNQYPIPAMRTKATLTGYEADIDVLNWTLTLTNNTIVVYVLGGTGLPKYAKQGMLDCTGSLTVFKPGASLPLPTPLVSDYALELLIRNKDNSSNLLSMMLNKITFTGWNMPTVGPNELVVRTFDYRGLGDGTNAAVVIT